jgi:glycosidase
MKKSILFSVVFVALLMLTPVTAQEAAGEMPWWNNRVFYEIFVRSFYDSDGDGIGDLQGVIQKLDYLNDGDPATTDDLGITGIWLMPIMTSPSYHGYDVTDYRTVNPDYSTNEDFAALMEAAHERGIAIIVDLVINHTSSEHPWFVAAAEGDAEYRDWYRWDDSCPTYRGPWGQVVWIPREDSCYYAVFWEGMPDLNYQTPAVMDEMSSIARYWLQDMGADGFRLDGLRHIIEEGEIQENTPSTLAWAAEFHDVVQEAAPDSLTVGEVWSSNITAARYVPDGADLVFEFDLATAMMQAAMLGRSPMIAPVQNGAYGLYPPNQYAAFLTNHDMNRAMNQLRTVEKAKVAANLLLTQPGVPFIYYGEEIGMRGAKPDELIRTPMQWEGGASGGFSTETPWEPLQEDVDTVNVALQTSDSNSLLSHYRNLIHLRNEHPALAHGDFVPIETDARSVYSFLRRSADETLLVLLNLDDREAVTEYTLNLSAGLSGEGTLVRGEGELTQPSLNDNGGFADYAPLAELAPYSVTVIQFAG